MGNSLSHRPFGATGKVILWDGTVQELDQPVTAAELMLEHPQQVVVELRSAAEGKRPAPLPADAKLDIKKVYVMLPLKRGQPASLSSEQARHVLVSANTLLRSRSLLSASPKFLPLFARMCSVNVRDMEGFSVLKMEEEEEQPVERFQPEFVPECLDERPEFLSRQLSGKGWKPSLETIKEKKVQKRVPHWLF